eukprot:3939841-Rhodomonas_salina.2
MQQPNSTVDDTRLQVTGGSAGVTVLLAGILVFHSIYLADGFLFLVASTLILLQVLLVFTVPLAQPLVQRVCVAQTAPTSTPQFPPPDSAPLAGRERLLRWEQPVAWADAEPRLPLLPGAQYSDPGMRVKQAA